MRARAAEPRFKKTASIPAPADTAVVPPDAPHSIRLKVPDETIELFDEIQGRYAQRLRTDVGDFVVFRRDGIIAYQLAVVVDDAAQGITQVVRGADLLDNTPRQLLLFRLLGASAPRYAHVPVLVDRSGQKLSKQTRATAVDAATPCDNLRLILALLGHDPPNDLRRSRPERVARVGYRTMGSFANTATRNSIRVRVHLKGLCYHRPSLPGGGVI